VNLGKNNKEVNRGIIENRNIFQVNLKENKSTRKYKNPEEAYVQFK